MAKRTRAPVRRGGATQATQNPRKTASKTVRKTTLKTASEPAEQTGLANLSRCRVYAPELLAYVIEDEIIIVGAPSFKGRRLSRDDLEQLIWISREEGSATRMIADEAMADLGIVPQRRLDLPSWEAIKLAARRGSGIAACSRLSVAEELEVGTLIVIPYVPWKVRRTFSIVRIRDAALTPAAHQFLLMLRERWGHTFSRT
jgi:DNA-binding transcriptional LysR family regulator